MAMRVAFVSIEYARGIDTGVEPALARVVRLVRFRFERASRDRFSRCWNDDE